MVRGYGYRERRGDERAPGGLIGALLTAIGPISMRLYTPAITEIVHAFGTTEALVKLTLTLYFGGFACAQLSPSAVGCAGAGAYYLRLHGDLTASAA